MSIAETLRPPYYVHLDGIPDFEFNREIIEPGKDEAFPDGAIGLRVDGDFWAVAALPYSYRDVPLKDIVADIWPQYLHLATFGPDSRAVGEENPNAVIGEKREGK